MNIKLHALSTILSLAAFLLGSVFSSPANAQSATDAQVSQGVPVTIGTTYSLPSKILKMDKNITVRLPYRYTEEKNAERSYPVLYLVDGGPEQDYPHIAGIAQLADTNYALS